MQRTLQVLLILLFAYPCKGQTLPTGFSQTLVTNGLLGPTTMAFAPDGRLFIAEQGGRLKLHQPGVPGNQLLLALNVDSLGERGLIGVTFDPGFPAVPYVYVHYTVPPVEGVTTRSHNRISRFTMSGNTISPASEFILMDLSNLGDNRNHNGGALQFGFDGKLYVAVGDAGGGLNAQNLDRVFGKILRLNPDGTAPADNPFAESTAIRKYFWSYGLRNPFTLALHPQTGKLFINDVGLKDFEEINDGSTGGKNYGWPDVEGFGTDPAFENPVFAYGHGIGNGVGCAITGGTFFSPSHTNYPAAYYGKYFYLDFCQRWINYIDYTTSPAQRFPFATLISNMAVCIIAGPDGNLYYISRSANAIYRLEYNLPTAPYVTQEPTGVSLMEGDLLSLAVNVSGTAPFEYQWKRDGIDIPGATGAQLIIPEATPADSAVFTVEITNQAGSVVSDGALVRVTTVFTPPVVSIQSPAPGFQFVAGESIQVSGTAIDNQEGILTANTYAWQITYHVSGSETNVGNYNGTSNVTFTPDATIRVDPDGWYEVELIATDSTGLSGTDRIEIHPQLSTIEIQTDPPGLEVSLDGVVASGFHTGVVGSIHEVEVESPQLKDGSQFTFLQWEPALVSNQLVIPSSAATFVASFELITGLDNSWMEEHQFYPNPATNKVCLETSKTAAAVQVYSLQGSVMWTNSLDRSIPGGKVCINTENWARGIYLVAIVDNAGQARCLKMVLH